MPVYYVIYCQVIQPSGYYTYRILKVIETTMDDALDGKHSHEINPFYGKTYNPNAMIFEREPNNPFRDANKEMEP